MSFIRGIAVYEMNEKNTLVKKTCVPVPTSRLYSSDVFTNFQRHILPRVEKGLIVEELVPVKEGSEETKKVEVPDRKFQKMAIQGTSDIVYLYWYPSQKCLCVVVSKEKIDDKRLKVLMPNIRYIYANRIKPNLDKPEELPAKQNDKPENTDEIKFALLENVLLDPHLHCRKYLDTVEQDKLMDQAINRMQNIKQGMLERGEKLKDVDEKMRELMAEAADLDDNATDIKYQYAPCLSWDWLVGTVSALKVGLIGK